MPSINFICLVLCRMSSIVTSIAAEPPRAESPINLISGILLCPGIFDTALSYIVIAAEITEITAQYISDALTIMFIQKLRRFALRKLIAPLIIFMARMTFHPDIAHSVFCRKLKQFLPQVRIERLSAV